MYTADPVVNITTVIASGDIPVPADGDKYDYRYYSLVVNGASATMTLNGQSVTLSGSQAIPMPIHTLTGVTGSGVTLFGTKSAKSIFGNYGSSSEGLEPIVP